MDEKPCFNVLRIEKYELMLWTLVDFLKNKH